LPTGHALATVFVNGIPSASSIVSVLDGSRDDDGDGLSYLQELLAGTNPTNSASFFGITAINHSGDDIQIVWKTAGGRTNTVQAAAGTPDGCYTNDFADLPAAQYIIPGSGNQTGQHWDLGGATNAPAWCYRVRLVL
jgi:hypothetical protein